MGKRDKNANGEGSVHKRADGRWQAIVTLPTGKRKYYYRATRAEAYAARTKALHELAQGLPVVAEKQTVAEFLVSWLEGAAPSLAPRSYARYRSHINHHLIPALGRTKLSRLTAQQIQVLYAERLKAGAAAGTVRQMHAILHRALGDATRLGALPRNVATLVTVPKPTKEEMHTLSPEEAKIFLAAVEGERLEALYVVALTTGMRLGELLGLRWRDVDLDVGALHVRVMLRYRNSATYYFEPAKTVKSKRKIGLSSTGLEALRRHKVRQAEERLAAGPAWRTDDLVFATVVGGALNGNQLSGRNFPTILKRAGLPHIRFHDLRHTCATLLLRGDVHPKVVSEMLGHSTIQMTLDRYSHVLPDMQQVAMVRMDAMLR